LYKVKYYFTIQFLYGRNERFLQTIAGIAGG
jgi:hypothetical protein